MHDDLDGVLRAVATYGMPRDHPGPALSEVQVTSDEWPGLIRRLGRQRLTGLAAAAVADGELLIPHEHLPLLAAEDRRVQVQSLRAERATLDLVDRLAAAGISHRVLKGAAYAHALYTDPAHRPFVDVDLLVPADAISAATELCEAEGADRVAPELRSRFDERFAKSVTLRHRSPVIEIDLHRTLALGPLAHLVDERDLWGSGVTLEVIPGRSVTALDPDAAFLHACLHVAADRLDARWLTLRDVVETARSADWPRCREMATRWSATGVVVAAVDEVAARGVPVPRELTEWSAALAPTRDERRIAEIYARASSSRDLLLAALRYVPGLRAKVGYGWALLVPSAANRRRRGVSASRQVRRLLRRPV